MIKNTALTFSDKRQRSIDAGISYLCEHQFPNGEFASYVAADAPMQEWIRPDSTNFTTALICHCLLHCKLADAVKIQQLAMDFLGGQMDRDGVWNHFTRYHPFKSVCPDDVDDTASISSLFRDKGLSWPDPSNIPLLLANRRKDGLFYTWFITRFKLVKNRTYWRVSLKELLNPLESFIYWIKVEATRKEIDGVSNANVLYYLGQRPETEPAIDYILKIIKENTEADCDLWYRDSFFVYYFFSRNYYSGIERLKPIVQPVIDRILAQEKPGGGLGECILDTAWAICTLLNFGHSCPQLDRAVHYLLEKQLPSGSWPRWLAYYGGPKKVLGWGSEELTTAFCIEAICRYSAVYG